MTREEKQKAIDALKISSPVMGVTQEEFKDYYQTLNKIKDWLEQELKTGHWEQYGNSWEDKFKCSECGKEQPKILCGEQIIGHWSDYCPNCGCHMVEPQESEE